MQLGVSFFGHTQRSGEAGNSNTKVNHLIGSNQLSDEFVDDLLLEALACGQTIRIRNLSSSMWPIILPYDVLVIRRESIGVGDIGVARLHGRWIAHRVVEIDAGIATLVAATGSVVDQVPHSSLVGRVIAIERGARSRMLQLRDKFMQALQRLR